MRGRTCLPVATSHSQIDLSLLPVASVFPSGANTTDSTSVCPLSVVRSLRAARSQSLTVLPSLHASVLPSGLNVGESASPAYSLSFSRSLSSCADKGGTTRISWQVTLRNTSKKPTMRLRFITAPLSPGSGTERTFLYHSAIERRKESDGRDGTMISTTRFPRCFPAHLAAG